MEISTFLNDIEKTEMMVEWWTEAHALIVQYGVSRKLITEMVQEVISFGGWVIL